MKVKVALVFALDVINLILGYNANKTITFSHAMYVLLPNYVPGQEGNSKFPFGLGMKLILPREKRSNGVTLNQVTKELAGITMD